jgi:hypothetical protein
MHKSCDFETIAIGEVLGRKEVLTKNRVRLTSWRTCQRIFRAKSSNARFANGTGRAWNDVCRPREGDVTLTASAEVPQQEWQSNGDL